MPLLKNSAAIGNLIQVSENASGFRFVIDTTQAGTTANNQFEVPTTGTGYDYRIDWGDGNINTNVTGNIIHTYLSPGTYTVEINGSFPRIFFSNTGDRSKLIQVLSWGDIAWANMSRSFFGCTNLISISSGGNFSAVTSFSQAWRGCSSLTSFPLLDTRSVTSFSQAWRGCSSLTSFPLLDTRSVTRVSQAWFGCTGLENFPLLDTRSVFDASQAWRGCSSLTSFPALNLSAATNLNGTWDFVSQMAQFLATGMAVDFDISNNQLNAEALNIVYANLATANSTITVADNPGVAGHNPLIATDKGWTVIT